ncbi:Cation/calcium exchanger 4 [Morus notabilis]|uniref:Cation/calcium exchanger 4 n=1 Tax=Morus notabilis TaxID=981085 RepID=W9RCS2_9ROSA|nr:cation/calcium exchanger 2 [Morus notabilis]EXB68040.1 Cation/calcium exchanger 4 [Morus notabilis]
MDTSVSMSKRKQNYIVFLNISFVLASSAFLILHFHSQESFLFKNTLHLKNNKKQQEEEGCKGLHSLKTHEEKCSYLKSIIDPCVNQGYIDYLSLYYCKFESFPFLGYSLLFLWLLVLFYLLGNTASEYFCSSLESLSDFFNLSPTIAGVTLLSLGNGAPDVFSSLVSFMGSGTVEIGLNTVLGGASFVSCVVVGVISIVMHKKCVQVNKADFVRDVFFLLLVLLCLTVILVQREIDLWGAITFFSIYIVYVIVVYFLHTRSKNDGLDLGSSDNSTNDLTIPILASLEKGELNNHENNNSIAIVGDEEVEIINKRKGFVNCGVVLFILEFPLYLPRRLTIPVISEDKWSKFYAVASVTLAPILLAILGIHQIESYGGKLWVLVICGVGVVLGVSCGVAAYIATEGSRPPKKFVLPWLAAGFLMSVTWSYITAQELVGLLVSLAYIFGVDASILGLTVLAWGNSIGDLVTNLTMALNGAPEGAQIAFSGCYAGPIFNTLFGLGLSLIGYCWSNYPSSVTIPGGDNSLLQTMGFLAAGLFWALLVLPRRGMRLDGVFGGGLLVIYIVSISLSLFKALGSAQQLEDNNIIDAY